MEEAASAASSSSDASLEGWLRSGCDPPEGGNCFLTKANAEVVFTSVLDCVFGRGDFGHLKVEIVPPGCTRENEDEWEEQFNEDYIGVDEEECYEVPLETRIMHPRGDRGYEAAMQEYAGELLEEKVSEVRANQRELQSEIERTKIRKRAWSFARIWLARQGQPISDGDRREAINVFRASREWWFSSTGAKSAAQKVSTLRGRGLPPPVLEETLLMLIVDDLLGDWRRGEPSHPRKLRLPMWDEYWGEYDFECWWYNGARGSIEESAPVNLGARGELAGVVALANVVVVRCQKNHDDFMSDDGLEQLVRRLYKDSPVALCVALPAVKAALSNAAAAGYCEEYCLEDIANRILPALRNLRDAPSARDMGSMATSMSAWLAGSPTTEGKKRPRAVDRRTTASARSSRQRVSQFRVSVQRVCLARFLFAERPLRDRGGHSREGAPAVLLRVGRGSGEEQHSSSGAKRGVHARPHQRCSNPLSSREAPDGVKGGGGKTARSRRSASRGRPSRR
jgi:hypothetical protein